MCIRWARGAGLVLICCVLVYILYRWVLTRTFVRLRDHSMALLLERRYDEFHDSLLTSVEMSEHPDHAAEFNEEMLDHTRAEAMANLESVHLSQVFDYRPIIWKLAVAVLLVGSIGVFALLEQTRDAFPISIRRLYLLMDDPWPRKALVEVVGIEMYTYEFEGGANPGDPGPKNGPPMPRRRLVPFDENRQVLAAEGTSPVLVVRARVRKDVPFDAVDDSRNRMVKPDYCMAYFRTNQGSVRSRMLQRGGEKENFQEYATEKEPLKNLQSSIRFDVRGYDYRVNNYEIKMVDSPAVFGVELERTLPDYLINEELNIFATYTLPWNPGSRVERGCKVIVKGLAYDPEDPDTGVELSRVHVFDRESQQTTTILLDQAKNKKMFEYEIPVHDRSLNLDFYLEDVNGQIIRQPYQFNLGVIEDKVPVVEASLKGIGPYITPNAILPIAGPVSDDHGIKRTWIDFELPMKEGAPEDNQARTRSFELTLKNGHLDESIDLQKKARDNEMVLTPGDKISITIRAVDFYDLGEEDTNMGEGDKLDKEVVTPEALLIKLENREVNLRRRFEQIIMEMSQARDILFRVKTDTGEVDEDGRGVAPEDVIERKGTAPEDVEEGEGEEPNPLDQIERQQVRVQRVLQQSRKAAGEVMGIALAFDDIRLELINNKLDVEGRKDRLENNISKPLKNVAEKMLPELDVRLEKLDLEMGTPQQGRLTDDALEQADLTLLAMNDILEEMLYMETFNEFVDEIRELLEDLKQLNKKTKDLRRKEVLEGI